MKNLTNDQINRRSFLKFLGASTVTFASISGLSLISSCTQNENSNNVFGIKPSKDDDLVLTDGLSYDVLVKWKDKLRDGVFFGDNNDYTALIKLVDNRYLLWVNHEYTNSLFSSGLDRNKKNVDLEMEAMGGSIIEIIKDNNKWRLVVDSNYNKRITARTMIPFANGEKVLGQNLAMGTNSNCAGGVTPWGTILTCEENYQNCWGERKEDGSIDFSESYYSWEKFYKAIPEHYGWVVEVDVKTGKAKKHTCLGRFSHECATVKLTKKNLPVIYSGDDKNDECLYKFIGTKEGEIGSGILYVADLKSKKWIPLDFNSNPILKKNFSTQQEILINCRKAAKLVGGTPLDRPEDIEIDPLSGSIFVSLTNNKKNKNYMGQILKLTEKSDYDALEFEWETYITGGEESGFACPDNMAFDKVGNLWICTDISGSSMNKAPYEKFCNNGLFVIPRTGPHAGKTIQVASAPKDAELTGITFDDSFSTMFLSVQHPGEMTRYLNSPTSTWPDRTSIPKSAVVTITGKKLEDICHGIWS